MMSLHAGENVRKNTNSRDEVGSFIQHDAFGALTHGGIRNFRPRGHAFLRKSFQNLCGPNHRNVSGLADPKNLLLDLRQTLIATFDRKITTGNHNAKGTRSHGGENEVRQIVETLAGFNLENQAEMLAA